MFQNSMNEEKRAQYCQCKNKYKSPRKIDTRQNFTRLRATTSERNYIETMNQCLDVPYGQVL